MRKIFCLMIFFVLMIVSGCTTSSIEINSTDDEIKISASNVSEGNDNSNGSVKVPEGSTLQGEAKISSGKLIIKVGNKEHTVDKTGEFFIDVPGGNSELFYTAQDNLTGEIILHVLPKI